MIDDLMKRYGIDEGEEKLDKQQFAELLKPILQDIADALALNHLTVESNVTLANGGILKQVLTNFLIDFWLLVCYLVKQLKMKNKYK